MAVFNVRMRIKLTVKFDQPFLVKRRGCIHTSHHVRNHRGNLMCTLFGFQISSTVVNDVFDSRARLGSRGSGQQVCRSVFQNMRRYPLKLQGNRRDLSS